MRGACTVYMSNDSYVERENTLVRKNNENLYDQIKLCIIADYFPRTLSKLPSGTMEFFVRDGELAINYHTTKFALRGPKQGLAAEGMNRSKLLTLLLLLEDQITGHPAMDYGSITITYELLENGEVDGEIEFKTQVNHRRR